MYLTAWCVYVWDRETQINLYERINAGLVDYKFHDAFNAGAAAARATQLDVLLRWIPAEKVWTLWMSLTFTSAYALLLLCRCMEEHICAVCSQWWSVTFPHKFTSVWLEAVSKSWDSVMTHLFSFPLSQSCCSPSHMYYYVKFWQRALHWLWFIIITLMTMCCKKKNQTHESAA